MNRFPLPLALIATLLGASCSLQPPAHTPMPALPAQWNNLEALPPTSAQPAPAGAPVFAHREDWWAALNDAAINALIPVAEHDAPTLALAAARVQEARANLGTADAARVPQAGAALNASRGPNVGTLPVQIETQAVAALNVSWEIDLFGRLRHGVAAAQARLEASDADAVLARLTLDAQVVDTVLLRRGCALTLARQRDTVASSERTLALTETKREAGFAAPLDVARSRTSVGEARSALVTTRGQCRQYTQTLANLTGLSAAGVEAQLQAAGNPETTPLPDAPPMALALPASVLSSHPSLLSAARAADAAFEDVGSARARRLPSFNLTGQLADAWIKFGSFAQSVNLWSWGPNLAMPLFDGGAGAANVAGARARYEQAIATLRQTVRDTVRDVELALIQGATADDSLREADATLAAARDLFGASQVAQQAGRLSLFDLEIARSALLSAETNLVTAQRDRARAWVALVRATANAPLPAAPPASAEVLPALPLQLTTCAAPVNERICPGIAPTN